MNKPKLTIARLLIAAKQFRVEMSAENHASLIGVTDGKAVGTYVEKRFKDFIHSQYALSKSGNAAKGIDLPQDNINTDIKVTSLRQPQSSCLFSSARQKIYGLGYNLLVFVYNKNDTKRTCTLDFCHCVFVNASQTGDYTLTKRLIEMLQDNANREDIVGFLADRHIPGDEITYAQLAQEIIQSPPLQGYLTISNALQWRLQYQRVLHLTNTDGIIFC